MVSNQDFSHSTVQSRPCALSTSTIFVFAFLAFLRPLEIGLRWFCGRKMHFGALSHGRQISSRPPLSNGIHNLFSSPTQAHRVLFQRRLASPACVGAFYAKFYFFALLEVKVMFNVEEKIRKLLNNNSHSRLQPNASSTQWISTWSKAVRFASCGLSAIHRFANLGLGTFSSRTWTRLSTTRPCTTHSRLSATFWAARWHRTKLAHQRATGLCTSKLRSRQICPSTRSMVSEWLLLPLSWQHMVYFEIRMLSFVEIWRFYSLVSFSKNCGYI